MVENVFLCNKVFFSILFIIMYVMWIFFFLLYIMLDRKGFFVMIIYIIRRMRGEGRERVI